MNTQRIVALFCITLLGNVGCGDGAIPKSKSPVVIDTNNDNTNNDNTNNGDTNDGDTNNGCTNNGCTNNGGTNNGGTNNGGTNNTDPIDCCSNRECGAEPGCEVSCGACGEGEYCDETGTCQDSPENAPVIIDFSTNVNAITPNNVVRFTAIVTDPDGIDDLIGGSLKASDGGTYGSFQTAAAEGSYQLDVTWDDVNAVQAILFDTNSQRTFVADFFDQSGNRAQAQLTLPVTCGSSDQAACEPGQCIDLLTTEEHCGACGNDISNAPNVFCEAGVPECTQFNANWCPAVGVCSGSNVVEACGSCGNDCRDLPASVGVNLSGDPNASITCRQSRCTFSVTVTERKSCDDACGPLPCFLASYNFADGGFSSACSYTPPAVESDLGAFVSAYCTCEEM